MFSHFIRELPCVSYIICRVSTARALCCHRTCFMLPLPRDFTAPALFSHLYLPCVLSFF